MDELYLKTEKMISNSTNIPNELKSIVASICKGYIRETNGKINAENIQLICNTFFEQKDENDKYYRGIYNIYGSTLTDYEISGNVKHKMCYINTTDYIELIMILTHEIGHVITEYDTFPANEKGIFPLIKKTINYYKNCYYKDGKLYAESQTGFRITDGFLESISSKIFASSEFRQELLEKGYDLKDYVYKDERLFPSRIYDEFKACYELLNKVFAGKLFEFACTNYNSIEEIRNFLSDNRLTNIIYRVDDCNEAMVVLKEFEGKERNIRFKIYAEEFLEAKKRVIKLIKEYAELNNLTDDEEYQKLLNSYINTIKNQPLLPFSDEETSYLIEFNEIDYGYSISQK